MNRDGRNLEDFLAAGKACKLYTELSCTPGGTFLGVGFQQMGREVSK